MKKFLLGSGLFLAATAAAAQVTPYAPAAPRDGVQTRSEVVERTRAMFARVDTNRDGFITQAEMAAVRGQRTQRGADPARRDEMFARLDTNRDNMISRDEWARAKAQGGQRAGMRGERMAMRDGMGGAMLRAADTNGDQRISLAEAETAALRRFDRLDLNHDGRVTQDERQQARQQWQAQRPAAAVR